MQMRLLLTGGSGYIGQYTAKLLKEKGVETIITSRKADPIVMGCQNRQMELLELSTIKGICRNIDVVIHMANLNELLIKEQPKEALLANAYATRDLYLDALENGVKHFIYLSTFHVYGKNYGDINENTTTSPQAEYGLTHLFAEEYLRLLSAQGKCKVSVMRLTNGIGIPPKNIKKWYLVLNDFCKTAYFENRIIMKSNGLPVRDFVAIKDVAKALLTVINNSERQTNNFDIYNISSQTTYSMREIAQLVEKIFKKRYNRTIELNMPSVTREQIKMIKPLMVYSTKLRALGWMPDLEVADVIEEIFDGLECGMYEESMH